MQADGLRARVRKRFKLDDDERPRSADRRQSARPAVRGRRGRISAGSATPPSSSSASSGKLYLAAILDLYSRFVVGWALSAVNDRHLTIKALEMALQRRCPDAGLLHHSDQGCTYASEDYQRRPERAWHHLQHESPRQLLRQRGHGELLLDGQERARRAASRAAATPRWSCSTTSKCSITSGVGTRRSARSARRRSSDSPRKRHNQTVHRIGSSPPLPGVGLQCHSYPRDLAATVHRIAGRSNAGRLGRIGMASRSETLIIGSAATRRESSGWTNPIRRLPRTSLAESFANMHRIV